MGQSKKDVPDSPEWDGVEREFPTYRIRKDSPRRPGIMVAYRKQMRESRSELMRCLEKSNLVHTTTTFVEVTGLLQKNRSFPGSNGTRHGGPL